VVVGDVRHPGDLGAAVQDVAAVVSAITGFIGEGHVTPASIDRDGNGNLIGAATTWAPITS
jgi:hypothetical protein